MKCVLSNKNFTSDYVEQVINSRGGDFSRLVAATSNDIEDPDLLDNIGIGANLFKHFVFDDNSKIALVVDCDPDGYTSSAIIYLYIKQLRNFLYFVIAYNIFSYLSGIPYLKI